MKNEKNALAFSELSIIEKNILKRRDTFFKEYQEWVKGE